MSLLADLKDGVAADADARAKRDEILVRLKALYSIAPQTTSKAYRTAQKALKVDEELTFSDKEIDVMMPKALRRTDVPEQKK